MPHWSMRRKLINQFFIDNIFPYKQLLINSLKVHRNEGDYDFS